MPVDVSHLYPPSPANVPADLTKPSDSYRNRVLIVLTGTVIDKLARILFKSLGAILALQESIAERWAARDQTPTSAEMSATADPTTAN